MQTAGIDRGMTKSASVASGTVKTRATTPGLTQWGCWPTVLDMTVTLYRYCACDDREKGLTALFMKFSQSHFVTLLYCK